MKINILLVLFLFPTLPLFSQKIDRSLPPSYRSYVTPKEYRQLLKYTLHQLEGFNVYEVQEGNIRIQLGEQLHTFPMLPLIQQRALLNEEQQQTFIQEYISTLIHAYYDQLVLVSADFTTVKKYLSLRLYPSEVISEANRERWVVRSDIEGTITCVMLNLPTAFVTLERKQLQQWGVHEEEIFRLAQENSQKRSYEVHQQMLGEGIELLAITGGDYAAGSALALEQILPEHIGHYGAIVAIPHREVVLLHTLEKEQPLNYKIFIEQVHTFVLDQYTQHTAPVSPDFYWYYQGEFTRIFLGKDQEGQLQILPPQVFSQLIAE